MCHELDWQGKYLNKCKFVLNDIQERESSHVFCVRGIDVATYYEFANDSLNCSNSVVFFALHIIVNPYLVSYCFVLTLDNVYFVQLYVLQLVSSWCKICCCLFLCSSIQQKQPWCSWHISENKHTYIIYGMYLTIVDKYLYQNTHCQV
jgi:hypothetical protein